MGPKIVPVGWHRNSSKDQHSRQTLQTFHQPIVGPTALDTWCCSRCWYATCSLPVSRLRASSSFARHLRLDNSRGYSLHNKWSWQMVFLDDRLLFGGPPPASIWRGQNWGSNIFWSQFSASHRPGSGPAGSWGSSRRLRNKNSNSPTGQQAPSIITYRFERHTQFAYGAFPIANRADWRIAQSPSR